MSACRNLAPGKRVLLGADPGLLSRSSGQLGPEVGRYIILADHAVRNVRKAQAVL